MLGYVTEEIVINEAGFTGNENLDFDMMRAQIRMAEGIVNGCIGYIYQMPFAYRTKNKIKFTGEGTGSGDLSIVINGTTYTAAITSGMTASRAADLMRVALAVSTTFVVAPSSDLEGNETVVITSISDDPTTGNTQVDVAADVTVQGVTATEADLKEKQFPFMIEGITKNLAAALILRESYGKDAALTDNDGKQKFDDAMALLLQIKNEEIKVMKDVEDGEIPVSTRNDPLFNPSNASTALDTDDDDYTPPVSVKMNDTF